MKNLKQVVYGSCVLVILTVLVLPLLTGCGKDDDAKQQAIEHAKDIVATREPAQDESRLPSLDKYAKAAAAAKVKFVLPEWEKTTEDITRSVNDSIKLGNARLDAIAALKSGKQNFGNTIAALELAYYPAVNILNRIGVIQETNQQETMRDAALEANKKLQKWFIDSSFRRDVYESVQAYADTQPVLEGEDAMLLKDTIRDYRRDGMHLAEAKRNELQKLKTELNDMGTDFGKNISDANNRVTFSAKELDGLSEDFLNNDDVKTADGNYEVNSKVTWQYIEVMEKAKNPSTRDKLIQARYTRAMDTNVPLFTQILKHRSKIAKLLGYENWADYRTEPKMAKTAQTALDFEKKLVLGLQPKFEVEMEVLRKFKVNETGNNNAELKLADVRYYTNELKKSKYNIDTDELKNYFELWRVLKGMFRIFEINFGLVIEEVEPGYKWVDDLRLYAVTDAASGDPLGLIYMDMFPREGKYNHFAQFGMTVGKLMPDGEYQRPVVGLVCNFPPAANGKPSLLTHDHVETLFHEFGHALHSVLTQAKYASYSGTSVPRDFVEAPSQMLENWAWDKNILDTFAVDYRDETKKIPSELLQKMEEARLATIASWYRRQLGFGILDLAIHMTNDEAVFENFVSETNAIMGGVSMPVPEGTAFVASFGHLGGGYDAGYYGYAWAEAISADMASVFEQSAGGLMDPVIGKRLRDEIYAPGGSREIDESIKAFLGRERSLEPFFKMIGMD